MSLNDQVITSVSSQIEQMEPARKLATASTKKVLVAIFIIAILLRLASAIYQGNTVVPLPGIYDQISYDGLARRVVEGHGFSFAEGHWPATLAGEPTAHWSYLYTLYLATIYALIGPQPLVARLIQAVVAGILHIWLAWRIGQRMFGPTTGLIAAGLSAVYVYFFYYAGGLITETFYIISILWTFDATMRLLSSSHTEKRSSSISSSSYWRLWLELGLAIGVTVLLRQVFLMFVPFLLVWLWWNLSQSPQPIPWRSRWTNRLQWSVLKGLLTATSVVFVMIVPWTARNYLVFHTFVPLNTNAGFAFFWGNHPVYGTNFVPLLEPETYHSLIPNELLGLNEAELDRALFKQAVEYITADPPRFALLSISRAIEYFKFWPSSDSGLISNIARVGSFGICLPFILYGFWISTKLLCHSNPPQQRSHLLLIYVFVVVYTAIHLSSWALIRYRLPIDALLLIVAALGLENLGKNYFSLRRKRNV